MKFISREQRFTKKFGKRLYTTWQIPLDLLELLILFTIDCGRYQKRRFVKNKVISNPKQIALLKIHARSILIAREISALLKSGFADGANARWRSLHELAVISSFLIKNEEYVSERYLVHEFMKFYKDLDDFQNNCSKIGYEPYSEEEMSIFKKKFEDLTTKHSNFVYYLGYEWIPLECWPSNKNRTFKNLEKEVGLEHWRPYYNMSSDSIHSGAKGFNFMSVPEKELNKILFIGPSNYGLVEALHSTAISLNIVNVCLLNLKPSGEVIIRMKVVDLIAKEIGDTALKIHHEMEEKN